MIKKTAIVLSSIVVCTSILLFVLNITAERPSERTNFEIISHRGVHQDSGDLKGLRFGTFWANACEATSIKKPTHHYLENTVESIQAAFDYGATIVEMDIRPTKNKPSI